MKATTFNVKCFVCEKPLHRKPHLLKIHKHQYCSRKCLSKINNRFGKNSKNWKGGKRITTDGYVIIYTGKNHPMSNVRGYVLEHRLKISKILGRPIEKNEIVHHKNHDRQDNRLCNLELMSPSEHQRHHNPRLGTGKKLTL